MRERLTSPALNRALLARQGLLSRLEISLVDLLESIGALQAQYWPAVPVALWSRMRDLDAEDLYRALQERQLVVGTPRRARGCGELDRVADAARSGSGRSTWT